MTDVEYLYIIKTELGNGEILVEGRTAQNVLKFGFKTSKTLSWQGKARRYTSPKYIPAFVSKIPPLASHHEGR